MALNARERALKEREKLLYTSLSFLTNLVSF
jgi:hypothetical protein